jgi:hypothetical protein
MVDDELMHKQQLLKAHISRLRVLELRAATTGQNTPPEISIEIEEIRRQIRTLVAEIKALQTTADEILPVPGTKPIAEPPQIIPPAPAISTGSRDRPLKLEPPEGTMRPDSPFYVERLPADRVALNAMSRQGETLTIKGPRQIGKSSLLIRAIEKAKQSGKRVVDLDFQLFDSAARKKADTFFRQFCERITDRLGMAEPIDTHWNSRLGNSINCSNYLERVIDTLRQPLVLAMDEVDSILGCTFQTDFFSMLRSWHNGRATNSSWQQLDLALITSTEPYELIEDLNQSPFNVGEVIELDDFTLDQVADLNRRHGAPLNSDQIQQLMTLLNGHPYLVRRALYLVADRQVAIHDLFTHALDENGPFEPHLRRHLRRLGERPELQSALSRVVHSQARIDDRMFWRLRGAGLVRRDGSQILPRCQLYADYFRERLR